MLILSTILQSIWKLQTYDDVELAVRFVGPQASISTCHAAHIHDQQFCGFAKFLQQLH